MRRKIWAFYDWYAEKSKTENMMISFEAQAIFWEAMQVWIMKLEAEDRWRREQIGDDRLLDNLPEWNWMDEDA